MYIERLTLENFKGFESAQIEFARADGQLSGWHVLAGPNGAGKSSALSAIALALRGMEYTRTLIADLGGQIRAGQTNARILVNLRRDADRDHFDDGHAFYQSRVDQMNPADPWSWTPPDDDPEHPLNAPPPPRFSLGLSLGAGRGGMAHVSSIPRLGGPPSFPQRGPWLAEPGRGWMIAGYGPQRRLQGHSDRALALMKENSGIASIVTLFHDDASLAEATTWLRELARNGDSAPVRVDLLIALLNDGLLPGGLVAKGLDGDGRLVIEQAGVELPIERLSDGYRSVTALVFDLVYRLSVAYGGRAVSSDLARGRPIIDLPGVVLIDEAETHLHPNWQKKLGFWLIEHFPALQFIVTTHSPFVCQAAVHGSLTRLSPPGDARPPGPLDEDDFWTVVNGTADDAVQTELFGLEQVISETSEALRDEIARLEVEQLRGTLSKRKREKLARLLEQLPRDPNTEIEAFGRMLQRVE